MGKKLTLPINEIEQLAVTIMNNGNKKGTNRLFNFAMNFNFDECKKVLKSCEESLHKKPPKITEYEDRLKEIAIRHSIFPETHYPDGNVPMEHIDDQEAFRAEAKKLKFEYQKHLSDWTEKSKENIEFKQNTEVEVDLYVIPSKQAPELEPKDEYWIGKFLDYSDQITDVPSHTKVAHESNGEDSNGSNGKVLDKNDEIHETTDEAT